MSVTASALRGCVLVTLAGLTMACGGDNGVGPVRSYGIYTLATRDGQAIPVTTNFTIGTLTVTSIMGGSVQLLPDKRHATSVDIRGTVSGTAVNGPLSLGEASATYSGNTVSMPFTDGRTLTGTLSGSSGARMLTVNVGPPWGALVFARTTTW